MENSYEQEQREPERQAEGAVGEPALAGPAPADSPATTTIPEDLRVPWDGMDLLLFLVFGLGSMILVAQVLRFAFAVFFALKPEEIKDVATLNTAFAVTHQVAWSLVMLGFLWLQTRVRFRAPFWRTLGFRPFRAGHLNPAQSSFALFAGGMLMAVGVQLISVFLRTPSKLPIEGLFQTRESILMMMAAGILVAPFVEEVMFRGFLYPVLARKLGVGVAIVLVGSLFGVMHAAQLWGGWGQIGLLILVGIVLTHTRARTGSVLASYLLHLGYNVLLLLGFFIATNGLRNLPPR